MGEVHHADDAEHHRVADGDETVDRTQRQPVDELLHEHAPIHEPAALRPPLAPDAIATIMPAIAPRRQRQAAGVNNRPAGAPAPRQASLAGARPHMRKPDDDPTMTGIDADDDAHHPDDDARRTPRRCGERHDDEMLNRVPPLVPPPGGADGPVVDARRFRDGMSRVAASVHVVTTDGPAGRAGFTATAVAPVTDSPASLLVCIDAAGRSARALAENGVFCVNTLAVSDRALAEVFAGRSGLAGEARFSAGRWGSLATGAPALETSLVAFDCRLVEARLVATHYVVIGAVVEVRLGPAATALAYRERGYHGL